MLKTNYAKETRGILAPLKRAITKTARSTAKLTHRCSCALRRRRARRRDRSRTRSTLAALSASTLVASAAAPQVEYAFGIGSSGPDYGYAFAQDAGGNVYWVGEFQGTVDFDPGAATANLTSAGSFDVFVAKYTEAGALVWAKQFGGTDEDQGRDIALDGSGNIYVTGNYRGTSDFDPGAGTADLTHVGGQYDVFVTKLDSNGDFVWAKSMGGTDLDNAHAIGVDGGGNVYASGSYNGTADFDPGAGTVNRTSNGGHDVFIVKLDSSGDHVWVRSFGGGNDDITYKSAVDSAGNVHCVGVFNGTADFNPGGTAVNRTSTGVDAFITKYDSSGALQWVRHFGGSGGEYAVGVDVDAAGNVHASGHFTGTAQLEPSAPLATLTAASGGADGFVFKLTSSGGLTWAKQLEATGSPGVNDGGVSVDSSGNVYLVGSIWNTVDFDPDTSTHNVAPLGPEDIYLARLDKNGDLDFAGVMGSSSGDRGFNVLADDNGNAYVTGYFQSTADLDPTAGTLNVTANGNLEAFVAKVFTGSPASPEIVVKDGGAKLIDGVSTVFFGTTTHGTPVPDTFFIENTGSATLNVSSLTLPTGFSLVGAFPSTIAAGGSASFQVQLDAITVGNSSGTLSFTTDDETENPFNFTIDGNVNKATSIVTIDSDNADPSTFNDAYTVAVTVTGPGVTPTGTVTIEDGDGNASTINLSGGTGSVAINPVSAGSKTLTATYNGDANYLTDTDTEPHTVSKATPTVTITSHNPNPNNVHVAVPVAFTVTPPHGGTPTGNVVISDDTGVTVTVDVSTGTGTLDCLPVGPRTITVAYQGDGNFNPASANVSHTVIGPDAVVSGNGVDIPDGDTTPGSGDDTDFGNSGEYPYVVTKTYTIRNDGTDTLNITGDITLGGDGAGAYTMITQPAVTALAPGASTIFSIKFAPEVAGAMNATVKIPTDDKTKADYEFAITGMIIPSAIDLTYNPGIGPNQKVIDVEVQADGKAVIVGAFISYSGVSRKYVARVGVDGSLDTSFDPGGGASHQVNAVDIHVEGKILIGGRFTTFDGTTIGRVARLNADGSLDTGFQTTGGGADDQVFALAVQPDQKILIGGSFQNVNGVSRIRIARLNVDGTVDTSFNAGVGPDLDVRYIELQADEKILVGGHFRKWNGVDTYRIIRLNSDGSVDNSFSSPLPNNGYVTEIIKDESDGDIYVSGGTRRLLRLNNDGSVQWDVGLTYNSDPNAILLTQDGKLITGGYFTKFGSTDRTRLLRLNANGSLNQVFDPQPGANKRILRFAVQPDGRIIAVGEFTTYRGEVRNFITRMINDIRIGPFFSLQPETQTVEEGTVFTLASMAEGELPITYQWYKQDAFNVYQALVDGGNISGTQTKDLVFNTITAADAGTYKVVATNPQGTADSDEVVLTITPNQAPTIDTLADLNLTEDDPLQTVNLTGVSNGAAHESGQTLVITATSSATGIIPGPTVTYSSGDPSGTLTFTPVADAHGTATITVTLTDNGQTANGGVTTTIETFDIIVASVNDTPTLAFNPTIFNRDEDSGAFQQLNFATFSQGPANEAAQTLNIICNNDNPGLFSAQPAIDGAGTLTFTPLADAFGTAVITAYAQDNGGGADTSPTRQFTININAVNDQPNFTLDVATVNFVEDSGFNQVTIITTTTRGPANEVLQKIDRYEIVGNTNPGLLTGLEVTSNGILKANTVNGVTGSTVVTIQAVDNGGTANGGVDTSATQSFTITVGPPNFPPDFDLANNLFTHDEGTGAQNVANFVSNVGPGDVSEAGQTVTFTISAADPSLFASGPTLTPNGNDYDLSYTPAADAAGSTLVTVTGTDDGPGNAAQNKTFTITLTEINDVPVFTVAQASVNALEDALVQTVPGVLAGVGAGSAFETSQTVTIEVTGNDNPGLFATGPAFDSSGQLTYTPAANASGTANLTIRAIDDGGTANGGVDASATDTVVIVITAVNDEPGFTAGGNVSVFRGDGPYTAPWATALNKGAPDETAQTLTFNIVNNDNPGLFAAGPAIDGSTGNLSFTPAVTANGSANITVELTDDGGTLNGGDDTSAQVTFVITISGSQVFVDGSPSLVGDTVTVPIDLNGTGIENSVSFTLDYDATRLVFDSATAPAGTIVVNSGTSGKVGVLIVLGAGSTFSAGNNNIANLTFSLASTATAGTAALSFSSSPVLQQVTDASAGIISGTTYVGANVTLSEGTSEGDVAPRPLGNGSLSVADATAIGRFAAGLDTANNGREFQAADSAPIAGGGDAVISIADWVQNLRDIAGLDGPARPLAGPTQPAVGPSSFSLRRSSLTSRQMTVETDGLVAGRTATVRLVLDANGTEAGFSCSLQFDPGSLAYVNAATTTGGMLIVNSQQAANGTLGIVLALQPGQTIPAGRQTLVELTVNVSAHAAATTMIDLNSSPVLEEVTDANARRLPASFIGQSFPVQLPAGFEPAGVEIVDGRPRFTFGNNDGSAITADQLNNLEVYATSNIGGAWTRLDNALQLVNGRVQIVDPDAGNGLRFYQVRRIGNSNADSQLE